MKTKTYRFSLLDKDDNELRAFSADFYNIKDARLFRDRYYAESMEADCVKIKVSPV